MAALASVFTVAVGKPFSASLVAPAGITAGLGARVETPVARAIVSSWTPAVLVGEVFTVTLDGPLSPGGYELVWRTRDDPPAFETFVPLVAQSDFGALVAAFPKLDPQDVRPSVDDVAQLERTRTVGAGGEDEGTFTDTTSPTVLEVEDMIENAVDDVIARLPLDEIDPEHYSQVQRAATLQAALLIETSFFREQANDAAVSVMRTTLDGILAGLSERITADLAQQNLLGGMEPYTPTRGMLT